MSSQLFDCEAVHRTVIESVFNVMRNAIYSKMPAVIQFQCFISKSRTLPFLERLNDNFVINDCTYLHIPLDDL